MENLRLNDEHQISEEITRNQLSGKNTQTQLPQEITQAQLPEGIIEHIQFFLNAKEAAQITILSKAWNTAWLTRPNLILSDHDFATNDSFLEFAMKTIRRYEELKRKIQSFRLQVTLDETVSISIAMKLIAKAMELGATDVDIECRTWGEWLLPREVLESKTLIRLSLHNFKIDLKDKMVSCCSLKYLKLRGVRMESNSFWDIISMCPSIEEIIISGCKFGDRRMKIEPGLGGGCYFPNLKVLCLNEVHIGEWFFLNLSSRFPCLKDLAIEGYIVHKEIQICSNSLEFISFAHPSLLKVTFDVPRICKFKYFGSIIPSLSFITTPRESEISFMIYSFNLNSSFVELRESLLTLSPSKISLRVIMLPAASSDYHIGDIAGLPVVVEKLVLMMYVPQSFCDALLDSLFRCCRPSFVKVYRMPVKSFMSKDNNDFVELLCKTLLNRSGNMSDLEEVNVEFFDGCTLLPYTTLLDVSEYSQDIKMKVCFQLTWGGRSV